MRFWAGVVLAYVIVGGALVAVFGVDWRTGLDLLVLTGAIIPVIIRRSPRLYLAVQRARYYIANTETTWELALQFHGAIDRAKVEAFVRSLLEADPKGTTLLQSTSDTYLVRYHRIVTLEFVLSESDAVTAGQEAPTGDVRSVDVTLFEQQVGFRRSKAMLEESLIPLVERIRNALQPVSTSYALRVRFSGTNPFLGMYLQQLKPELVQYFQFQFTLPAAESGDYVKVDRDKMVVWSGSQESFRRAVLAGLTFSAAAR